MHVVICLVVEEAQAGVAADLERHGVDAAVLDVEVNPDFVPVERIDNFEIEVEREHFQFFRCAREYVAERCVGVFGKVEAAVLHEAVLGDAVLTAVELRSVVPHAAGDGEQKRRALSPESGVALPKAFASCRKVGQALHFCASA